MKNTVRLVLFAAASALVYLGVRAASNQVVALHSNQLTPSDSSFPRIAAGTHIDVTDVSFSSAPWTMILVTSPDCPHCVASKRFHQAVARQLVRAHIPFIVALPFGADSSYIDLPPHSHTDIRWNDIKGYLQGTPTLILVDNHGAVADIWAGELHDARAAQVISRIQSLSRDSQSCALTVSACSARPVQ